jgi:hypothetical protein
MLYYQCKCGEVTVTSSMGVPACDRCPKCGSRPAPGPRAHVDPVPHEYETRFAEDTGRPYERCRTCHRTREELASEGIDGSPPAAPTETKSVAR